MRDLIYSMTPRAELLAPLNNWKSLAPLTKVLECADAVYFGIRGIYSMRARADNFPKEDIPDLVKRVHEAGKKIYLTTNIIIYDFELVELHQIIEWAKDSGVDAIICYDIASIMIAKQLEMPFHISTQANISNRIAAKYYETLGAERIILARELSLVAIAEIGQNVDIPIECFVHGAQCTAVSGRCYLSAELMGNDAEFSANRGKCVQPCRRVYTFQGEEGEKLEFSKSKCTEGMFFNAMDLCMIAYVPEMIEAGIAVLKIEGRMRDPQYLAETVQCYREAIDSHYDGTFSQEKIDGWVLRLQRVFNRGFHTGYYFGRPKDTDIQRTIRGNISPWHKVQIGKVINYYKQAGAAEIELYTGQISSGDTLIFENKADLFHKQKISTLQLGGKEVKTTPVASKDNHIIIGVKVDQALPKNASVYLWTIRRNPNRLRPVRNPERE